MAFKFNPLTSSLDLVNASTAAFDPDTILSHSLTPFGSPLKAYDTLMGVYYDVNFELVFDASGNIVTS